MDDFWTDAEDTVLTIAWGAGVCTKEISQMLSELGKSLRSRSAVIGRAHRLRLPKHKKRYGVQNEPVLRAPRDLRRPSKQEWIDAAKCEAARSCVDLVPLLAGSRNKPFVAVRRRAWNALHVRGYSYKQIGIVSGFDHTSVRDGLLRLRETS